MDPHSHSAPPAFSSLPLLLQTKLFSLLSPRTLAVCACVSRGWSELVAEQAWREAFAALWPPPLAAAAAEPALDWQRSYAARQSAARCWLGRPSTDKLIAHRTAVKACCLLPGHDLLITGGVDRTVRAWDLQSGVQLACSRRHGGTVRCVAADATLLASGSSDHAVRVWRAGSASRSGDAVDPPGSGGNPIGSGSANTSSSSSSNLPFDLAGERAVLEGHAGPVSCLQLTPSLIISGSWDCSMRLWDRASLQCVGMVHTDDWVLALAVKGGLLAAACGASVQMYSLSGGTLARLGSLTCPSLGGGGADVPAAVTAVDCTADGRNVFMGTGDGGVWLADVASCCASESGSPSGPSSSSGGMGGSHQRPVLLQRQPAEVAGLSWDHPWLAVADRAGNVALLDAGTSTEAGAAAVEGSSGAGVPAGRRSKKQPVQPALTSRVLFSASMGGAGAAAQCVCLDGTWAAAGLDCGTALSFDGSKGQQQLAAAAAARQQKADRRQRNLERQQQQQQQRSGKGGGSSSSVKRSQAVPIPPRTHSRQGEQQQQGQQQEQQASPSPSQRRPPQPQQGQPDSQQPPLSSSRGRSMLGRSPSARVPPPLPPEALAAAGSCRHQAWHVLRAARPAGGAEGSTAGPAPQP